MNDFVEMLSFKFIGLITLIILRIFLYLSVLAPFAFRLNFNWKFNLCFNVMDLSPTYSSIFHPSHSLPSQHRVPLLHSNVKCVFLSATIPKVDQFLIVGHNPKLSIRSVICSRYGFWVGINRGASCERYPWNHSSCLRSSQICLNGFRDWQKLTFLTYLWSPDP
jgi:hypothetical protein